jgi:hypothetical protein
MTQSANSVPDARPVKIRRVRGTGGDAGHGIEHNDCARSNPRPSTGSGMGSNSADRPFAVAPGAISSAAKPADHVDRHGRLAMWHHDLVAGLALTGAARLNDQGWVGVRW